MSTTLLPPPTGIPPIPPESAPDLSTFIVEDGAPVDSIYQDHQRHLLVETLNGTWRGPDGASKFLAVSDCGLFYAVDQPPVVPDMMLSLDVELEQLPDPLARRSYFQWVIGKPPEVVVEMVSHTPGQEDTRKLSLYGKIGVSYYIIFDPHHYLGHEELRIYARRPLGLELIKSQLLGRVGLGVTVWEGDYLGSNARWLRWTDPEGNLLLNNAENIERAETEAKRAETEAKRADELQSENDRIVQRMKEMEEKLARFTARLQNAGLPTNGQ